MFLRIGDLRGHDRSGLSSFVSKGPLAHIESWGRPLSDRGLSEPNARPIEGVYA